MSTNIVAFTKSPQVQDAAIAGANQLIASRLLSGRVVKLDLMANDLGGIAKWLYSVGDGNGAV